MLIGNQVATLKFIQQTPDEVLLILTNPTMEVMHFQSSQTNIQGTLVGQMRRYRYPGAIGIREADELHVIDHWCYLGTARTDDEVEALLQQGRPVFDRDTYMTLVKALKESQIVHFRSQTH